MEAEKSIAIVQCILVLRCVCVGGGGQQRKHDILTICQMCSQRRTIQISLKELALNESHQRLTYLPSYIIRRAVKEFHQKLICSPFYIIMIAVKEFHLKLICSPFYIIMIALKQYHKLLTYSQLYIRELLKDDLFTVLRIIVMRFRRHSLIVIAVEVPQPHC